ncbi:NUDIX hydrolase [Aquimarina agarilytica]|uniref:NUDIX hydrolase n=1 Tax=Aquimarina agarilytica TaxID=1087449 RepID=UPI00028833D4|nr:CoA pyrophosphatase [Aquimarina agarilytica]
MKFEKFLKGISKIEKNKLPGALAQMELSPKDRVQFSQNYVTTKTREAGVMALFYAKNEETFLALILRTTYDGAHSGQVALPGGKFESSDLSLWNTALREVEEEIGVAQQKVSFIKSLSSLYVPVSDFRIYPFIAKANEALTFHLQEEEVAKLIEMPLSYLIEQKEIKELFVDIGINKSLKVPAFEFEDHIIWGATGMILNELKQLLIDSFDV